MKTDCATHRIGSLYAAVAVAAGMWAMPAGAAIIAEETFNYSLTPPATLDGASGGTGWQTSWAVSQGSAVAATALSYAPYNIGADSGAAQINTGVGNFGFSRTLNDVIAPSVPPDTYWIRALYNPGTQAPDQVGGVFTPFEFDGAGGGKFTLNRIDAANGMELRMSVLDGAAPTPVGFTMASGSHMLLWRLNVAQSTGAAETLDLWVDPQGENAGAPASFAYHTSLSGNMLTVDPTFGDPDYLHFFNTTGLGDTIDQLAMGTLMSDVAAVPEPGTLAMSGIVLLGVGAGVAQYRSSRKKAQS